MGLAHKKPLLYRFCRRIKGCGETILGFQLGTHQNRMVYSELTSLAIMKPTIQIGNSEHIIFHVTEEMSPVFHNTAIHEVCSTWDLSHQFELAARLTLEQHLEDSEQGIGSHISINHIKPAPVGKQVDVIATIIELDETTVVCELVANIGERVVATGKQIQRVLSKEKIAKIIKDPTAIHPNI